MIQISDFKNIRNPPSAIRCLTITSAIILVTLITPLPVFGDSSPTVRLLIAEKLPRVVVSGNTLQVEMSVEGTWQPAVRGVRRTGFAPMGEGVRLDGTDKTASNFRIRSRKGMLSYAGRAFRGDLTVRGGPDGLSVVSYLPLESYLVGVVNGEIDSSWPMEAVKAQVVAARSYALYQVNSRNMEFDLKTDVTSLVYAGVGSEDERASQAVRATRGQVLYKNGSLVQAFFHSSCGGTTTSALEVWGMAQPAQEGVFCGQCEEAPHARWNLPLDADEIKEAIISLYPGAGDLLSMGVHRRSGEGRVQTLFVETGEGRILIDAGEFRKIIGYRRLRSTKFSFGMSGDRIVLTGEGYGHGVGLCQWGARGSALRGMDYRQILRKYYVGAEIRRAY